MPSVDAGTVVFVGGFVAGLFWFAAGLAWVAAAGVPGVTGLVWALVSLGAAFLIGAVLIAVAVRLSGDRR